MSREATESGPVRREPARSGSRGSRSRRGRLAARTAQLAWLALFAYLLVGVHTLSHSFRASTEGASPPCAVCGIGKQPVHMPAIVSPASRPLGTCLVEPSRPKPFPTLHLYGATFARAPPSTAVPIPIPIPIPIGIPIGIA